jgi:excisionase family DNA binding protein
LVTDASYTIKEFCEAEKLSRAMLYRLWAEGKGPRWFCIGTHRRISQEARTEWRHEREVEASGGA